MPDFITPYGNRIRCERCEATVPRWRWMSEGSGGVVVCRWCEAEPVPFDEFEEYENTEDTAPDRVPAEWLYGEAQPAEPALS